MNVESIPSPASKVFASEEERLLRIYNQAYYDYNELAFKDTVDPIEWNEKQKKLIEARHAYFAH